MKSIEACQEELQEALTIIRVMTDKRDEAIRRLDAMIEVLKAMENGDLVEALELISEACLRFGLSCL